MTEGLRYDQDKPPMELLDAYALEELTKVLAFGKKKYAAENWRQGINTTRLIGAALRHLFAFLRGESNDPESGLSHVAHAMCCCMFILWMVKERPDMDDRRAVKAVGDPTTFSASWLCGCGCNAAYDTYQALKEHSDGRV